MKHFLLNWGGKENKDCPSLENNYDEEIVEVVKLKKPLFRLNLVHLFSFKIKPRKKIIIIELPSEEYA